MSNDTSTLSGSLDEMKDQLIDELGDKGVNATFDSSTGLLGLISRIGDIQQSGGGNGGATNIAQGTFTTDSNGGTTDTINLNYNGNGYPIVALIFVHGGIYNSNTSWYTTIARYDVGLVLMVKSDTTITPTYQISGSENYGAITYLYKSSTSSATTFNRSGTNTAITYTASNGNATGSSNMIKFKGDGKTLAYYVGNRTSASYGLARDTQFDYIVIYSS